MKAVTLALTLSLSLIFPSFLLPCQAQVAEGTGIKIESDWQSFEDAKSTLQLKYPQGWKSALDEKSGRIDLSAENGAVLSILPFSIADKTVEDLAPPAFFKTFISALAPGEIWTTPTPVGKNGLHSVYSNDKEKGAAALLVQDGVGGLAGLVCIAKVPQGATVSSDILAGIMNSVRLKDEGDPDIEEESAAGDANYVPPETSAVNSWTTFTDPSENAFTVDVPAGWTVTGGMSRYSALDVRPWVKAVSPDQLITAFIGDGKIAPCVMPTATLNALGRGVGSYTNGSLIQPYIPARQFVEKYARMNLKPFLSDLQVVHAEDHPEIARAVNGTVGATRSEAATIKMTGMYGSTPAIAYYLAVTKATVGYGTGMWWVTKVAGTVGPAERDNEALGVILHMLGTFAVNPSWASNSLRNTVAVSQHYRRVSQQVSQAITDRYWSQQAHNDRMNQSYWNRQASQDRAANNFSNYIRGVENVQDPDTGSKYQVQYGPQGHYIDTNSNYIYSGDNAPGPEWRQLLSVP